MASPINTPLPIRATAVTNGGATEFVVVTSSPVNIDSIETVCLLDFNIDVSNSASGATLTLNVRRGSTTAGTLVQAWGPYDLTASKRSAWGGSAFESPGQMYGGVYSLTATVASNAATFTVNAAIISIQTQAAS